MTQPTEQLWCTECCRAVDGSAPWPLRGPDVPPGMQRWGEYHFLTNGRSHFPCGPVITSGDSVQEQFVQWCYPEMN